MFPAVRPPRSLDRRAVDLKLKPGWRYDAARGLFVETRSGRTFDPPDLPRGARLVYKVPSLAAAQPAKLSTAERDLQRYMQVILPAKRSPAHYLATIRAWPSVEAADAAPEVSLPARLPP